MAKGSITLSGSTVGTKMESLEVEQGATGGVAGLFKVDNDDTDKVAMSIEAANIDADVLDVTMDAVTTAKGIDITADGLTTGGVLYVDSDSSSTGTRSLVEIINNNTAATGATALKVQQDSSGDAAVFQGGNIRVTKGGSAFQTALHHAWVMGG
jgi:hypothetical protein